MPDPKNKQPRDKNQPFPKEEPKSSLKSKLAKLLLFVALFCVTATMVAYSLRLDRWPWAWSQDDWKGYLTFSQEKAQAAKDEIVAIDWSKFGEKTKQLWNEAPDVGKKIEEKLGGAKSSTGTSGGGASGGNNAAKVDPSSEVTPEHKLALEAMRDGITHYRKSPTDKAELALAKQRFEEAQGHFEKALKETNDDKAKGEIQQELKDCNKYLEDCRAREKS